MGVTASMNEHYIQRLFDQAQQFVFDGKWLHAAQIYQRIIDEVPDYIDVYFRLANVYAELRNAVAAEQILLKALTQSPDNVDIIYALGSLHLRFHDLDNALHYFNQLLPLRLPQVHFNMGLIYFMKENLGNAERHFRLTVEYDPEFTQAYQTLGEVLLKSGQIKPAIDILQHAVNHEPRSWFIHYQLGIAFSMSKAWKKAADTFYRSLEIKPDNPDAMCLYADVLIKLRRLDEAESYLHKALSLDKSSAEIHTSMALLALARSDKKSAKKYFNKALELDTTNFRALEGLQLLQPNEHAD